MAREIAREDGLHFKMALIQAEQDKASVKRRIAAGRVGPLARQPALTDATIDRSDRIVGMMGPDRSSRRWTPARRSCWRGGRATRHRGPPRRRGRSCRPRRPGTPAKCWNAAPRRRSPKGHDCLFVTVREDHVECEPTNPARRCTPLSIANHSLHENSSPIHHIEPGGMLDTSDCRFDAVSDRAVRISGMRWSPGRRSTRSSWRAWNWRAIGRSACAAPAIRC